jgi:uncharacterized membrane protein YbhN (UPF0104 family)
MTRVVAVLRSRAVRHGLVVAAVALALVAVVRERDAVGAALGRADVGLVVASAVPGAGFLVLGMLGWRAVLADLGSNLPLPRAFAAFFVGQLGKYLPGGVWNVVAVAELTADLAVPRRRSLAAMAVATLVSVVTGLALGAPTVLLGAEGAVTPWAWAAIPVLAVGLAPPVLNRLLAVALRWARRPPLEQPLTAGGVARAAVWSSLAWASAGAQTWLLAVALGTTPSWRALASCTGAYAMAWIAGFLVFVLPAGIGAREAALAALLPAALGAGGAIAVALLVRVAQTVADLVLALVGWTVARRLRRGATPGPVSGP